MCLWIGPALLSFPRMYMYVRTQEGPPGAQGEPGPRGAPGAVGRRGARGRRVSFEAANFVREVIGRFIALFLFGFDFQGKNGVNGLPGPQGFPGSQVRMVDYRIL